MAQDELGRALAERRWAEVRRVLDAAGAATVDELDLLGTATYLIGRDEEAFDLWARAHRVALDGGDPVRAARLGMQLAHTIGFKGDMGRTQGWVERVRHILDDAGVDCVELGYLEFNHGVCRILGEGDVTGARDAFARATKIADRYGDRALRTLARIGEGRCLIYLGELAEGVALLDEAMVSVTADELPPVVTGDAYCTVIDALHELFDLGRCETWVASFRRWCDAQPDIVIYRGQCLLHGAEVLQVHGRWDEAVQLAQDACRRLAEPVNLLTLGGAHYVEAELHRLRGDASAAEQSYARAHECGCDPHPGLSLLRLAQGDVDAALAAVRRVLAGAEDPMTRGRVLGPFVEIALAGGDVAAARTGADELRAIAELLGSPLLRAHASHHDGAVRLAEGDVDGALAVLRSATAAWIDLEAPYDLARTRLVLADACDAVGDREGSEMERRTATSTLEGLRAAAGRSKAPAGLTAREVEVLRLVARGKSNKAIAGELFISEKTVTSHLTHVFTKLGVTSRSEAAAFAYDHGLLDRPSTR